MDPGLPHFSILSHDIYHSDTFHAPADPFLEDCVKSALVYQAQFAHWLGLGFGFSRGSLHTGEPCMGHDGGLVMPSVLKDAGLGRGT